MGNLKLLLLSYLAIAYDAGGISNVAVTEELEPSPDYAVRKGKLRWLSTQSNTG